MSRLHVDAVEVQRYADDPAQFLWRGRLYLVREVLSRWTESGGWWRAAGVRALSSGEALSSVETLSSAKTSSSVKPASFADQSGSTSSIDDGEQDWFRVEAGCPPFNGPSSAGTGVFDLCFSWSSGRWTLARVLD